MAMATSMLMQSIGRMHAARQHEPERGRSRTPKSTSLAVAIDTRARNDVIPQSAFPVPAGHSVPRRPPRYATTRRRHPNRSHSPVLGDVVRGARAQGTSASSQGVSLDWGLGKVTEDDLCLGALDDMDPESVLILEDQARVKPVWSTGRVWKQPVTAEKTTRIHTSANVGFRTRSCRAPRGNDTAGVMLQRLTNGIKASAADQGYRAGNRPRSNDLFPVNEAELSVVRSMWLDQGRKGLAIAETLMQPVTDTVPSRSVTPRLRPSFSSDSITTSSVGPASTSLSSASTAPSTLFSSTVTAASSATSTSTITRGRSPSKISAPHTTRAVTPPPATGRFTLVSSAESPLHTHTASVSLLETLGEDMARRENLSTPGRHPRHGPRRKRTVSDSGWFRGGFVEGIAGLVGRLPTSYAPVLVVERERPPARTTSCPPSSRFQMAISESSHDNLIHLLPLRVPSPPRRLPPIPSLPRSPYRPLIPPAELTPRARVVANPQYLRLKALQNRVMWGRVLVPPAECQMLVGIARRHQAETRIGGLDVDRHGRMFTAKEALLRLTVDGVRRSGLHAELTGAEEAGAFGTFLSWWQVHFNS